MTDYFNNKTLVEVSNLPWVERLGVFKTSLATAAEETPGIDGAMDGVGLRTRGMGVQSARELALALYLILEKNDWWDAATEKHTEWPTL